MKAFQPVWEEEIYGKGRHLNLYPYDAVVSFVFRNAPRDLARAEVRVLEIGCGAGNNIWFLAREGFAASGLDGSASAIEFARRRLAAEGLSAELEVGDFTRLPFEDGRFHLAFERGALVCVGLSAACRAVHELHRVLRTNGRLLATPYSSADPSANLGQQGSDGTRTGIIEGPLAGLGDLCFWDEATLFGVFACGWTLVSLEHHETRARIGGASHAEWRVVAQRETTDPASLRPAGPEDCDRVLEWRNHPWIVERSTSRARVAPETHRTWFAEKLQDPNHLLLIAEGRTGPMGLVRLERVGASQEAVITAYLLPEFTDRGLGPRLIAAGCRMAALRMAGLRQVVAHVRNDNPAGRSGFLKAGFHASSPLAGTPEGHSSFLLEL